MKIWILLVLLVSFKTFAFPEMVRHHYNNCIACHESPSGGGLLTQYGRTISATALSTWGSERGARAIYGATDVQWLRDYFNAGVDLRAVQFHQATPTATRGQFILMQTAIESSLRYENFKIVGSFGKQEEKNRKDNTNTRPFPFFLLPFPFFLSLFFTFTPSKHNPT